MPDAKKRKGWANISVYAPVCIISGNSKNMATPNKNMALAEKNQMDKQTTDINNMVIMEKGHRFSGKKGKANTYQGKDSIDFQVRRI